MMKILKEYNVLCEGVEIPIRIYKDPKKFVPIYEIRLPKISEANKVLLTSVKNKLISMIPIRIEFLDAEKFNKLKGRLLNEAKKHLQYHLPKTPDRIINLFAVLITNEMLGLGTLEILVADENLEEIVVNCAKEPVWVYHKQFGWLLTNVFVESEAQIENYASIIGRRVGRSITLLNPLLNAHLYTGDRVNATLFPVSTKGNTLTIRKFRRRPWTITDLIENNTLNLETTAFLWEAIQYELSFIVAGGTASGKTTLLNALMAFIPPNHRIISIEDTRELNLPEFLHWVPLTTREPNPEGRGEVSMLDLLVNSLRMRPDRIIVGEIRREKEAEVLFEALRTGHSVYSTLHANTADETLRRLTTPPINLPKEEIESLPGIVVMYRHRRLGIRRLFELAEVITSEIGGKTEIESRVLYKWSAKTDKILPINTSIRILQELSLFTGLTAKEVKEEVREKIKILKWMLKHRINTLNTVGKVVYEYYLNPDKFVKRMKSPREILGEYYRELK